MIAICQTFPMQMQIRAKAGEVTPANTIWN